MQQQQVPQSPRRRKSLELPDLNNRLSLTPATLSPTTSSPIVPRIETPRGRTRSSTPGNNGTGGGGGGADNGEDVTTATTSPPSTAKRVSLMTGTRAKSPLGESLSPPLGSTSSPSPLSPSGPRALVLPPPLTPGLPHYSHSPNGAQFSHMEDVSDKTSGMDQSKVITLGSGVGRHPTPAKPAPAIVTRHEHSSSDGIVQTPISGNTTTTNTITPTPTHLPLPTPTPPSNRTPQHQNEVILSSIPRGASPFSPSAPSPTLHSGLSTPPNLNSIPDTTDDPASFHRALHAAYEQQIPMKPIEAERHIEHMAGVPGNDGEETVMTLVQWNGGGKDVYVTGTFAEGGWKTRLKMQKRCVCGLEVGGRCEGMRCDSIFSTH